MQRNSGTAKFRGRRDSENYRSAPQLKQYGNHDSNKQFHRNRDVDHLSNEMGNLQLRSASSPLPQRSQDSHYQTYTSRSLQNSHYVSREKGLQDTHKYSGNQHVEKECSKSPKNRDRYPDSNKQVQRSYGRHSAPPRINSDKPHVREVMPQVWIPATTSPGLLSLVSQSHGTVSNYFTFFVDEQPTMAEARQPTRGPLPPPHRVTSDIALPAEQNQSIMLPSKLEQLHIEIPALPPYPAIEQPPYFQFYPYVDFRSPVAQVIPCPNAFLGAPLHYLPPASHYQTAPMFPSTSAMHHIQEPLAIAFPENIPYAIPGIHQSAIRGQRGNFHQYPPPPHNPYIKLPLPGVPCTHIPDASSQRVSTSTGYHSSGRTYRRGNIGRRYGRYPPPSKPPKSEPPQDEKNESVQDVTAPKSD